jgi:hypothetical protein
MEGLNVGLDSEDKQKRIESIIKHTKEEIATQRVTLGTDMKEKYDKLKIEFIEYKIANDISRFFEDVRSEKSDENNNNQVFVHISECNHSSFMMSSMESQITFLSIWSGERIATFLRYLRDKC